MSLKNELLLSQGVVIRMPLLRVYDMVRPLGLNQNCRNLKLSNTRPVLKGIFLERLHLPVHYSANTSKFRRPSKPT